MNQILIIAGIVGILLFLRWLRKQPKNKQIQAILIFAAIVLIIMAATGRLHWLFAIIAAAVAMFQKFAGLLRFLPFLQRIFTGSPTENPSYEASNSQNSNMTIEEACKVLGIEKDATEEEIIEAHRKLIQKIHPDRGGNDYLATKINQAKEFMLKNLHKR